MPSTSSHRTARPRSRPCYEMMRRRAASHSPPCGEVGGGEAGGDRGCVYERIECRRVGALKLRLQPAHEGRQAGLPLALEALGGKDCLHVGEGALDVVVDHHVVVLRPMAEL